MSQLWAVAASGTSVDSGHHPRKKAQENNAADDKKRTYQGHKFMAGEVFTLPLHKAVQKGKGMKQKKTRKKTAEMITPWDSGLWPSSKGCGEGSFNVLKDKCIHILLV